MLEWTFNVFVDVKINCGKIAKVEVAINDRKCDKTKPVYDLWCDMFKREVHLTRKAKVYFWNFLCQFYESRMKIGFDDVDGWMLCNVS